MKLHSFVLALCFTALVVNRTVAQTQTSAPEVRVLSDLAYKSGDALTDYERTRCKLDVYLPPSGKDFPTLVWFHGGGLKSGDKAGTKDDNAKTPAIARSFARAGIAVVAANYRLSPKATYPAYVQDAAAAVAWAAKQMPAHGADATKLFVSGHSAGGYLTLMLGMDERYLRDAGVKLADIAGFIPVSGQAMTHYTIREERGLSRNNVTADEAAPVYFIRKETPPFLVLYADHDMAARAEENMYFVAMMQGAGNKAVTGKLITDRTHGSIAAKLADADDPARAAMIEFIRANRSK